MMIKVKVNPGSKEEEIRQIGKDEFVVSIKEPAENGEANVKLIKIFSKKYGVDWKKVKIKNPSSRFKLIEIQF